MLLQDLEKKKLIKPPKWLSTNCHNLSIMGSNAYGIAEDTSDFDIYGWAIPPRDIVFPHLTGSIEGFDSKKQKEKKRFNVYQEHHVYDKDALRGKGREYDFAIYNIVDYLDLCMYGNPNMIDSLFVSQSCILHLTKIGNLVRENRKMFLGKHLWPRYKGYAFEQMHKIKIKTPKKGGKREKYIKEHGYDVKFAYNIVRLLSEIEQIFIEGDLDLQEKGRREHMKAIRKGEVSLEEVKSWVSDKEKHLENLYHESKLPAFSDKSAIKQLLLNCLEEHYGSLEGCVMQPDEAIQALKEIQTVLDKHSGLL